MSNMAHDSESTRIRLFSGELNEMAFKEVENRLHAGADVSALIFGREVSDLAVQLASSGAQVVVEACPQNHRGLRVVPFTLAKLPDSGALPEAPFDVIVSQLVLHPLPYEQAYQALCKLMSLLKIGGKLYLSTYGLHSMIGDQYPDSGKRVEDRFAELPAGLADLYDLHGPLCLYSERNLFTLLFQVGASILQSATGALGNVRAVVVRI
jgi:hypothetical protein